MGLLQTVRSNPIHRVQATRRLAKPHEWGYYKLGPDLIDAGLAAFKEDGELISFVGRQRGQRLPAQRRQLAVQHEALARSVVDFAAILTDRYQPAVAGEAHVWGSQIVAINRLP